jgi:hypothetical protein
MREDELVEEINEASKKDDDSDDIPVEEIVNADEDTSTEEKTEE